MLNLRFRRKRSVTDRLSDALGDLAERATASAERAGDQATEAGRRAGARVEEVQRQARERAGAGRDAVAERVDRLARRAAEIRERRARERLERSARRSAHRAVPLRIDVRDSDRVILHGAHPVDVRTADGEVVSYRYGPRPGSLRRMWWRMRGREVLVLD